MAINKDLSDLEIGEILSYHQVPMGRLDFVGTTFRVVAVDKSRGREVISVQGLDVPYKNEVYHYDNIKNSNFIKTPGYDETTFIRVNTVLSQTSKVVGLEEIYDLLIELNI